MHTPSVLSFCRPSMFFYVPVDLALAVVPQMEVADRSLAAARLKT